VLAGPPVRLVATDLDGTFLRPDGSVSERNRQAVSSARQAGIFVVPITGRPPRVTWGVARDAGLGPLGVCCNGAALVDITAMEVVELQTISAEVCAKLVAAVRSCLPGAIFAVEELERLTHEAGFLEPELSWGEGTFEVEDIAEAIPASCIKLIVRHPGCGAGELLHKLQADFAEEAQLTSSGLDWVELGVPGTSKAFAMERLSKRLHVRAQEVLAVGDNYNDLSVLAWAGHSAAPANAIAPVLAAADYVLPANGEDGVAELLEVLVASGGDPEALCLRPAQAEQPHLSA
jgi:Cof subfamily protein (haloacid dehalogenase superfamily)